MTNTKTNYFKSCLGVFQGGGCRAVAFLGAYKVAIARGVTFVEVAGTSAGSIMAAFVATGATTAMLEDALMSLDFSKLLLPAEKKAGSKLATFFSKALNEKLQQAAQIYLHEGLYSSKAIEIWVEAKLKQLLGFKESRPVRFSDLPLPLSVVATDILSRNVKIWDSRRTPEDSVAAAIRASCSIPGYFQPVENRYYDGGVLANLPAFIFSRAKEFERPIASRALAFTLKADRSALEESLHPLQRLTDTVVDGAEQLQLSMQPGISLMEIPTGNVLATDFLKMAPTIIGNLVNNGTESANKFFDSEKKHIRESEKGTYVIHDKDELHSDFTRRTLNADSLIIFEKDTKFVYSTFPALLGMRLRNKEVTVLLNSDSTDKHEVYRRTLLKELGCDVHQGIAFESPVFIFDGATPNSAAALVKVAKEEAKTVAAMAYTAPLHRAVIAALYQDLRGAVPRGGQFNRIKIEQIPETKLFERLRQVPQYRGQDIKMYFDRVPLENLISLSAFVREFKLHNIGILHSIFDKSGINAFTPASISTQYGSSIITPPVVEKVGNEYFLIEGTTRAMFCKQNGIDKLPCIVVENAIDPLPSEYRPFGNVRVSGREIPVVERYEGFNYSLFRRIEETMHVVEDFQK